MKDLISKIDELYEFKEPWRATDRALTIVVPIVAKSSGSRQYYVLEEVKDKIKITDTGSIGAAKVESSADKPTFIRGGTILKGATQERTIQFGTVIFPNKAKQVLVQCIHATKGIRPGASFENKGHVPVSVYSTMLSYRSQSHTWRAAYNYYSRALASAEEPVSNYLLRVPKDDLASTFEALHTFSENLKNLLKNIPSYVDQVGVIILDVDGVVGLELYDHPDSWKLLTESIMKSFSEVLSREAKWDVFKPNLEAIIPAIYKFFKELETAKEEEMFKEEDARTVIIKLEGYVGEYTQLNGKTVHLLVTRCEKEAEEPQPLQLSGRRYTTFHFRPEEPTAARTHPHWEEPSTVFYTVGATESTPQKPSRRWKTRWELLRTLDKPKTWTSLVNEVPRAKATVASSLRDLQQIGAVEKRKDENGITRYSLTGIGYQLLKKKEDQP